MRRTPILALAALAPVAGELPAQSHAIGTSHAAPHSDNTRHTRVRLSTGVELDVAERGRMDGEPVLFLHGFTDSRLSFTPLLPHLPADVRAILPSQRGHGDSERPACCYRVADLANDAIALLDALGIQRATVVGHSMGSFVAQRLAIRHPERVARLVLVGSGATPRVEPVVEFAEVVKTLPDPVPVSFIREFQEGSLATPIDATFFEGVVAESAKLPIRVWRGVIADLVSDSPIGDPQEITTPTLIVSGEKDAFWDRSAQDELHRKIRGSRLLTYEGIGHSPNWEQPARLAADILAFMNGRSDGGPGSQ